jgi:hypothetical protein
VRVNEWISWTLKEETDRKERTGPDKPDKVSFELAAEAREILTICCPIVFRVRKT